MAEVFRYPQPMSRIRELWKGVAISLAIAVPSYLLGLAFPIAGGPVIAIIAGMAIAIFLRQGSSFAAGIRFTSKKVLQWAVILLGFGMNLSAVAQTGLQSLPIILTTITVSLAVAFVMSRLLGIKGNTGALIGIGSSICGGSAIAAAAPVMDADDGEIAQSISVIFFFNVLAALLFPTGQSLLFPGPQKQMSRLCPAKR